MTTDAKGLEEKEVLNLAGKCYAIARSSTEFDPKNEIAWHLRHALAQARQDGREEVAKYCDDCKAAESKVQAQSGSREFIMAFHKIAYWCRKQAKELESTNWVAETDTNSKLVIALARITALEIDLKSSVERGQMVLKHAQEGWARVRALEDVIKQLLGQIRDTTDLELLKNVAASIEEAKAYHAIAQATSAPPSKSAPS